MCLLIIFVLIIDTVINRAVKTFSFEIGFVIFIFHMLRGVGGFILLLMHLLDRPGSNHTCTYVTILSRIVSYEVNCEKC